MKMAKTENFLSFNIILICLYALKSVVSIIPDKDPRLLDLSDMYQVNKDRNKLFEYESLNAGQVNEKGKFSIDEVESPISHVFQVDHLKKRILSKIDHQNKQKNNQIKKTFKSIFKDFSRNFKIAGDVQRRKFEASRKLGSKKPFMGNVAVTPQINSSKITVYNFSAPEPPEANEIREKDRESETQNIQSGVSEQFRNLKSLLI